jgi:hypothetical protein
MRSSAQVLYLSGSSGTMMELVFRMWRKALRQSSRGSKEGSNSGSSNWSRVGSNGVLSPAQKMF